MFLETTFTAGVSFLSVTNLLFSLIAYRHFLTTLYTWRASDRFHSVHHSVFGASGQYNVSLNWDLSASDRRASVREHFILLKVWFGLGNDVVLLAMKRSLIILILKTIGNRKGDCAWSCSRWQTQPEKICKSQRTNQCHSLRTLCWFVLCNLQILSGCVCHLEQLHAQSPFLFPIVFSINLIPFFRYLLSTYCSFTRACSGMCCFTWATARSQQLLFVVLAAGLWYFTAGCHVKSPLFPQPPLKQKCAPRWEKA